MLPIFNGDNGRTSRVLVAVQTLIAMGSIIGGVWFVAGWTASIQEKIGRLDYRTEQLEKGAIGSAPQEGRLGRIEYRVDQLEKASQEDRNSRHQWERELKTTLDDITTRLTNMQILWAKSASGRNVR